MGERPLNLAVEFVLGTCICVPRFRSLGLLGVEKTLTGGGGFAKLMIGFSINFNLSF